MDLGNSLDLWKAKTSLSLLCPGGHLFSCHLLEVQVAKVVPKYQSLCHCAVPAWSLPDTCSEQSSLIFKASSLLLHKEVSKKIYNLSQHLIGHVAPHFEKRNTSWKDIFRAMEKVPSPKVREVLETHVCKHAHICYVQSYVHTRRCTYKLSYIYILKSHYSAIFSRHDISQISPNIEVPLQISLSQQEKVWEVTEEKKSLRNTSWSSKRDIEGWELRWLRDQSVGMNMRKGKR